MERSFKEEVQKLKLGEGDEFNGEGILAVTEVFPGALDPTFSQQAIAAAQAVAAQAGPNEAGWGAAGALRAGR